MSDPTRKTTTTEYDGGLLNIYASPQIVIDVTGYKLIMVIGQPDGEKVTAVTAAQLDHLLDRVEGDDIEAEPIGDVSVYDNGWEMGLSPEQYAELEMGALFVLIRQEADGLTHAYIGTPSALLDLEEVEYYFCECYECRSEFVLTEDDQDEVYNMGVFVYAIDCPNLKSQMIGKKEVGRTSTYLLASLDDEG